MLTEHVQNKNNTAKRPKNNTEYGVDFLRRLYELVTVRNSVPRGQGEPHCFLPGSAAPSLTGRGRQNCRTDTDPQQGGRDGASLETAEQRVLQFVSVKRKRRNNKIKSMALAVQTKPRPQGSDPEIRKNSKLQRASVLHANTVLTLEWQQELASRTGVSSFVLEFSLGEDRFLTILAPLPSSSPPFLFYRQMLICLASSRSRSWIKVSKSFRLSRQLKGASKSRKSSMYKPPLPPAPDWDHVSPFFFSTSSSSPLPEMRNMTDCLDCCVEVKVRTGAHGITCVALASGHLVVVRLLSWQKVSPTGAPVSRVPIDWRRAVQPGQPSSTTAGDNRLLFVAQVGI